MTREITLTNSGDSNIEWRLESDSSLFNPTTPRGTLPPNSSTRVKVTFSRSNLVEGDYLGTLSVIGNEEIYSIDLRGSVEVAPIVNFFYADPPAIIAIGQGCSSNQVSLYATILEDSELSEVEVFWSRDGSNMEVTSLQLSQGTWMAELYDFDNGTVPTANFTLKVIDSRGNETTSTTEIAVRPCST